MKSFSKKVLLILSSFVSGLIMLAIGFLGYLHRKISLYRFQYLRYEPRPSDIFIATYPRSGTTWMQMIVYQLISGGDRDFTHITQVVPFFERQALLPGCGPNTDAACSRRAFKTHLPYKQIRKGSGKYIYVARNGEDVALSFYNFHRSHLGFHGSFPDFFRLFMSGKVQYGSWFDHVAGWHRHKDRSNILFLRYEDLSEDLPGTIRKVAQFCGIEIDPATFPRIVEACSFAFMKEHEQKFDHHSEVFLERRFQMNSFLREGKVGQGTAVFTETQRAAFNAALPRYLGSDAKEFSAL